MLLCSLLGEPHPVAGPTDQFRDCQAGPGDDPQHIDDSADSELAAPDFLLNLACPVHGAAASAPTVAYGGPVSKSHLPLPSLLAQAR